MSYENEGLHTRLIRIEEKVDLIKVYLVVITLFTAISALGILSIILNMK